MTEQQLSNLKQQLAVDFITMLTEGMEEKCFPLCISSKANYGKLEKSEEVCLGKCMDKFMQAWNVTSSAINRINDKINTTTDQSKTDFIPLN